MKTSEIQADPLLDLKAVQSAYKLNLHTIRTIVNDDTMPVTWLGKKRYLRQSDLEEYIAKHTQTSTTQTAQEEPVEAPTKLVKRSPSKTTDATKKDAHKADSTHLLKALLTPSSKPKSDSKRSRAEMLEAEMKRRQKDKNLSAA